MRQSVMIQGGVFDVGFEDGALGSKFDVEQNKIDIKMQEFRAK